MAEPAPWVWLCKPLVPPYRDGTSVLVRNIVRHLPPSWPAIYFGDPSAPMRAEGDRVLVARAMGYQPAALDKATMLMRLMAPGLARRPVHAFFAANRTSSLMLGMLGRLPRRRVVLHTLPGSAGAEVLVERLGRLDGVIVTSDHGRARLVEAGLHEDRVRRIHPGVELPPVAGLPLPERRVVLFAGDLDPHVVSCLVAVAQALASCPGYRLEIAARPKAHRDAALRDELCRALGPAIADGRARVRGEIDDMPALVESAALQLYLADHALRKVDLPLALLEGMAAGVPVALVDAPPVRELWEVGQRHGLQGCVRLPAHDPATAADAVVGLLQRPAELAALGAGARALVGACFSAAEMAAQYQREHERVS